MPPLRTFLPVAPVKTERTHEENQERAYIAASRRSDRSLEARVESARRASEIHKRRTGRSLRVTEQDVLNEEMYEEEDDDLPSQYRRLTAHLQTGSADFNRRLAAYLTNHVAMRSALDQAITASYAQQFPNAPQFAHNQGGGFPSPFLEQGAGSPPAPVTPTSPHPYRRAPYPMPGMPGYRAAPHHRSASISNGHELHGQQIDDKKDVSIAESASVRRASMPTPKPPTAALKRESEEALPPSDIRSERSAVLEDEPLGARVPPGLSPFTTSLPPDTQQLVGSALDPTDPFTSSLMSGGGGFSFPQYEPTFYNYAPKHADPSFHGGMNSTLAPLPVPSQEDSANHADHLGPIGPSEFELGFEALKGKPFLNPGSEGGSNGGTPDGDGAWDAFIDESPWAENASV